MAASCRLRCCAVTAAAAEGDLRLPNPRLARSGQDRIKRRPIALPRGQGSGESAPWWRHTRVLARGHAAQGESRCVSQPGSSVTRVTGIARPVSDTVRGHHKSRYFSYDAICLRAIWVGRNGPIFSLSTPPHPHGHASPEEKRPRRARHPSRGALLARLSGPPSGLLPF